MLDLLAIFCAKYLIAFSLILAAAAFLRLSRDKQRSMIIFAAITLPIIYLTAVIAGYFYNNPRPFVVLHFVPLIPHGNDNGFPSDHMLLASTLASIWTIYNRRIGLVLGVLALFIGIARVYAGVHHPVDIIGSVIVAGSVTCALHLMMRKFNFVTKPKS